MTSVDLSERLGRFFEPNGFPRTAGRILGHLLTCDPADQSFEELVDATSASRSTVSVATRLLVERELVDRFGVPGERRDRYRLRDDAWTALLKQDLAAASLLRGIAEGGLRRATTATVRSRLRAMKEFFGFLEDSYAPLLTRWDKVRSQPRARRARK